MYGAGEAEAEAAGQNNNNEHVKIMCDCVHGSWNNGICHHPHKKN